MRIVLDTNVLVSGLLSPRGPSAEIIQLLLAGSVTLCVDSRILAEYRAVLPRPKFGFDPGHVSTFLAFLEAQAILVQPSPLPTRLPDPDDEPFLEVALAGEAHLVTGNLKHYPSGARLGAKVVTPRGFIEMCRAGTS